MKDTREKHTQPEDLNLPDVQNISSDITSSQNQIFVDRISKASRSRLRRREYARMRRHERANLVSAIVENPSDVTPYAEVTILGCKYTGLLDTGASISCIGGALAKKFMNGHTAYKHLSCAVKTPDGKSQKIVD